MQEKHSDDTARAQVIQRIRDGARLPVDLRDDLGEGSLRTAAALWVDGILDWDGSSFSIPNHGGAA